MVEPVPPGAMHMHGPLARVIERGASPMDDAFLKHGRALFAVQYTLGQYAEMWWERHYGHEWETMRVGHRGYDFVHRVTGQTMDLKASKSRKRTWDGIHPTCQRVIYLLLMPDGDFTIYDDIETGFTPDTKRSPVRSRRIPLASTSHNERIYFRRRKVGV
jgi:hypothetical protein